MLTQPFSCIALTQQGSIVNLQLNRPQALNSLNEQTMFEIHMALDWVQQQADARVLVIGDW